MFLGGSIEHVPRINKEKPKDINMELVALGNTRILTDYAHKSPRTLSSALHFTLRKGTVCNVEGAQGTIIA